MLKQLYHFLHPRFQNLFLEYKVRFKPRYGHGLPAHKELLDIIEAHRSDYQNIIDQALSYKESIWRIKTSATNTDASAPTWNNGFLPGLDIIAIYTLIRELQPNKYVEIGSGNSTKVAAKAKREGGLSTEIVSIDPMPRAEIDELADRVIRMPFEDTQIDLIEELNAGDILFVDNSHRILPNSDAMVFFLEILPRLKDGVIVHIHDVYLPYDYPQFMCDRFYSEQYGLAMYLLANPQKFQCLFPNYFVSEDKSLAERLSPIWDHPNLHGVERHGGSFWLKIQS